MQHVRMMAASCRTVLPVLLLAGLLATPARATLGPPVIARLVGPPTAAVAGQPWQGQVEIAALAPVDLAQFRLQGADWTQFAVDAPAKARVAKDRPLTLTIAAQPADPSRPLEFSFLVDGEEVRWAFDLSPAGVESAKNGGAVREVADAPPPAPAGAVTGPVPGPVPVVKTPAAPPAGAGKSAMWIHAHGTFQYRRPIGDSIGVDGATVRIHARHALIGDDVIATTTTAPNGAFDITFLYDPCSTCSQTPDLHVELAAANDRVSAGDVTWGSIRSWNSKTWYGFTGGDLDVGNVVPANEGDYPLLHLFNHATRTWRWLNGKGYDCPPVAVHWPNALGNSYYVPGNIFMSSANDWNDYTAPHEYGHHWMQSFSSGPGIPGYCNGVCDASPVDCGHCMWCPEDAGIAWNEGVPDWISNEVTATLTPDYGLNNVFVINLDSLHRCDDNGAYMGDPLTTEGFVGALLHDISDSEQGTHSQFAVPEWAGPPIRDQLAMGAGPALRCINLDAPISTVTDFLAKFRQRYAASAPELWSTAKNCGYEIDAAPPAPITTLTSPSHVVGGTSTDPTIDFEWTEPADDASGVYGYSIWISTDGPRMPPDVITINNSSTTYSTLILAPGTYWFNIRAVDGVGHWCMAPTSFGPVTISTAEPSNLAFAQPPGWYAPVVPSSSEPTTASWCPAPASLVGNGATRWNCAGENTGEAATSTAFTTSLFVDGVNLWPWGYGIPLDAHAQFVGNNMGPVTVRGGRHTFEARLDATDVIAEQDENDNRRALQWVWSPLLTDLNVPVTRAAPPLPTAGWEAFGPVSEGPPAYYNCDGLTFGVGPGGNWHAMTVRAVNNADDFDVRLHQPSTGPLNGFAGAMAQSARGAGFLDAVLVNSQQVTSPTGYWDVGVVNANGGTGNYVAKHVQSTYLSYNDSLVVTLSESNPLAIADCYVYWYISNAVTATVQVYPAYRPVTLGWFDSSLAAGGLSDAAVQVRTDESGKAQIDRAYVSLGYHGLVVYRDPSSGMAPVRVVLRFGDPTPDLVPFTPATWYAPLVPLAAYDTGASSVPAPTTLVGNAAQTWLATSMRNDCPRSQVICGAAVQLDGAQIELMPPYQLTGGETASYLSSLAHTVTGGRHTLALKVDYAGWVVETNEYNNNYGEQWVWSPLVMQDTGPFNRTGPPAPIAGWQDATTGEAMYYNCDGLRMRVDTAQAQYRGLAILPVANRDADLRLHATSTDTKTGYRTPLAVSQWGPGLSDFVIANSAVANGRDYDVGVVSPDGNPDMQYTVETVPSLRPLTNPTGVYGKWNFAGGHLLDLREFNLRTGQWTIRLDSYGHAIDWGISIYPIGVEHLGKSDVLPGGIAFSQGPGMAETMTVDIPADGWYCVAVWKVAAADLGVDGRYGLTLTRAYTSDVGDLPSAIKVTALESIQPNPFNPQTKITYALAEPGQVVLEVFDLRGVRVRTLVAQSMPAGRHEAIWDGRDDARQGVASGVYMVRMQAGAVHEMRKVLLMK